jgi:spermidine synthase
MAHRDHRPPLISLAMASGSALAYQLLLLRLFSIIQWHHFAYMIISLALLGYGASGTFLSLFRSRLQDRQVAAYVLSIVLFAAAGLPAFLLAQKIAFSPEELLWRPLMAWRLAGLYLVLGAPFFFVASAVGLALMGWGQQASRVYALDLVGAAAGGVFILFLLWFTAPMQCLQTVVLLAASASVVAALETKCGRSHTTLFAAVLAVLLVATPVPDLELSPFKDLSGALHVAGAQPQVTRSSPYGQVTAVANRTVPFRDAPGMGLTDVQEPPEQLALFIDGDFSSVVTRDTGEPAALGFLGSLPSAAPYALINPDRVLVLEAGGGMLALQARVLGAREVVAVERNPDVIDLVRTTYADFSGRLYDGDSVRVVRAHPRSFLAGDPGDWDLIQLPGAGGLGAGASGLFALNEDYLRTREAAALLLDRLAPGGILAAHAWLALPPRGSLRLAATLVEALRTRGVQSPGASVIALRSWQMATVLVRNGRFAGSDIEALRAFAAQAGYDLVWYDGLTREQSSRIHRMAAPWLYDAIAASVTGRADEYAAAYKFDIRPTTDGRPFFNNFLRWRTAPEAIDLLRRGGMPLLEAGYVLLLATLIQATLLGAALILLPLLTREARRPLTEVPSRAIRTLVYFAAIGLAFMLIELAAIHRFILFLEEPVFASAVVVSAFLVFAGAGSLAGGRLAACLGFQRLSRAGATAVVLLGCGWLWLLGSVTTAGASLAMGLKIVLALCFIGPLAFAMGQLFPAALATLSRSAPELVPWAWAVNGCASVIGAVLATVLAMAIGFDGCLVVALALYGVTLISFPIPGHPPGRVH